MSKGLLISIEGPDGAGKTTVLEALLPRLREAYPAQVVTTREPGGVAIVQRSQGDHVPVRRHDLPDCPDGRYRHSLRQPRDRAGRWHSASNPQLPAGGGQE